MTAYFFLIIAEKVISLLPRRMALSFGRFLGSLWYLFDSERRHNAKRNISLAFGTEKSYKDICRLARESFRHIGEVFTDSLRVNNSYRNLIRIENPEKIEQAFAKGKGLLFAIPHFGNWEILTELGNKFSRPLYDIAREIDNSYIERHILRLRKKSGMKFISKNDSARKILTCLRDNCGVGIFMDQNAGREGIYANFLGRKASTYPTIATLALRTGSDVLIIYAKLMSDKTYKIVVEGPLEMKTTGDQKKDIELNTASINARFEKIIRQSPYQYFWMHQRWKPIQNELMRREFRRVESIIIKAPNWMGDVIMTLPAISYVKKTFPETIVKVLIKESLADLIRYNKDIDEVMTYTQRGFPIRLLDELNIIKRIRRQYFNLAIVFPYSFSSALWMRFAGIPVSLGANVRKRGMILTHTIPAKQAEEHQSDYFMRIVRRLGTKDLHLKPAVSIGEKENQKAENILHELKIQQSVRVGIHPGAAYGPAKRWLPERFAELIDKLNNDGLEVMLFGSNREKAIIEDIISRTRSKPINLCGKFNIAELAAMMKKCDVVVTNDSGPMHLAGAVGTRLVAIFGSTSPKATSPSGKYEIIWKNVDCSPCFKRQCRQDFKCMTSILAEEVYEAVNRMLLKGGN